MQKNPNIMVNYNNESISVKRDASLELLIKNHKLMSCPLSIWRLLFIEKDGIASPFILMEVLKKLIENYDKSTNVNSFFFGEKSCWLDKSTRVGLLQLVNSCESEVSLVLDDTIITIPKDIASKFLSALEVYAGECYLNTAKHLIAIKELKSIEDIVNYDYTKGYPDKISLNE